MTKKLGNSRADFIYFEEPGVQQSTVLLLVVPTTYQTKVVDSGALSSKKITFV